MKTGPTDILLGILQDLCDVIYNGLNPAAWYLRSTQGYKMSTLKEKIIHLMFVDDLKTFQKSE